MKHALFTKFILSYLFVGIISFFVVAAGGSYLIEKRQINQIGHKLYLEARHISLDPTYNENAIASRPQELANLLSDVAVFQATKIWIANADGKVLLNTGKIISPSMDKNILEFAARTASGVPYEIGTFYDVFANEQLSVCSPVIRDSVTKGYVLIHYPMTNIYQSRSAAQEVMIFIYFIMYIICFIPLLLYHSLVHKPLQQIMHGTSEFANGNFGYDIPLKTDDEMGYLANSLNYMADRLNQYGEYQRRFIANVSHDFRSPLTSIKGYVTAMLDGTIPPELQKKYLNIIAYESERLEKLTKSLMTLNDLDIKKRLMHMHRFDINKIIRTTAQTFEVICFEKDITLQLTFTDNALYVRADMEQIQQVLYNLLDNAIKFSSPHSSIILSTSEKNGKVFVSVTDHGIGIPKEDLSKIWDRFYKLDSSRGKDRKGTGLGLSIVKEIINAHGQNINVISTTGVGTEFIFTLEKSK